MIGIRNCQNTLLDGVKEDMARNGKLRYGAILCLDNVVFSNLVVLALPLQARATALLLKLINATLRLHATERESLLIPARFLRY